MCKFFFPDVRRLRCRKYALASQSKRQGCVAKQERVELRLTVHKLRAEQYEYMLWRNFRSWYGSEQKKLIYSLHSCAI